jgi:hypothetical protein
MITPKLDPSASVYVGRDLLGFVLDAHHARVLALTPGRKFSRLLSILTRQTGDDRKW